MDPNLALGLWRSTFGAVKIEPDNNRGGAQAGAVQGVWVYQRQGQDVIGYFSGSLRGNVMDFKWQEPANPPLVGEGFLVFDVNGHQYSGRWWSDRHDRVGDWNGWRQGSDQGQGRPPQIGSQTDGAYPPPAQPQQGYPQQPPYPQQGYPQQQPYPGQAYPQQQPYPQQGNPQQPQQQPYYPPPQQQPYYPQQPQQPQQPPAQQPPPRSYY